MTVTIENQKTIAKAMAFPMDDILRRYALDFEIDFQTAKEHEREIKRFLVLCALNRSANYGMNGPIDDLWHTFLLFTREYQQFCHEIAGHFIHHIPNVPDQNGKKKKTGGDDYVRFLNDYEQVFGEKAAAHVWPRLPQKELVILDCGEISCAGCHGCTGCQQGFTDSAGCTGCTSCNGCESCGGHSE